KYLDRWDRGRIVHLKLKKSKGIMRILRQPENRTKSLSIKYKIETGQYDRFDFLFIRDLVKSLDKK
ncbi:MAG: hypothetical protein KAI84_03580, partial [Gammaproteobacteria bacterium]|nr:hypothetical protein [Gammaproteobacteria bacterium]